MMQLTILGEGTYQPELDKGSSSYLLQINNKNIVFDFGRGCINNLLKAGVQYYDVDTIFISHTHADHFAEIGFFLHINLSEVYFEKYRKKALTIYGPRGIKRAIELLLEVFYGKNVLQSKTEELYFKFEVVELNDADLVQLEECEMQAHSMKHSNEINCLGYRLKNQTKVFAYSGDTSDCPGLRKICADADVAIIEASWPDSIKTTEHLTGSAVGKIAQECNVKKVVLTHIAPFYSKNFDVIT